MTTAMTKIAARALFIVGVFALAVAAYAFGSRGIMGITFAQEYVNLTIDSEASYNGNPVPGGTWELQDLVPGVHKFFNFDDIKPGDSGENTISLHVDRDAWVCLQFTNLTQNENGFTEPESLVDNTAAGELSNAMKFFAWRDDGDNIYEPGAGETTLFGVGSAATLLASTSYAIADSLSSKISANQTKYFGIAWCAGDFTVLPSGAMTCDGSNLGNGTQTDSMTVDITLGASGVLENPNFLCNPPPPSGGGLGEQIGLNVKCKIIAAQGWPLPTYKTECPNGFGNNGTSSSPSNTSNTGSGRDRDSRAPRR